MQRRVGTILIAAMLGMAGAVLAAAPASAAGVSTTIAVTPSSVQVGDTARIHGRVTPNLAGRTVLLQRRSGGTWRTIARRQLSSRSRYSFTVRPAHTGRKAYRVVKPRSHSGTPRSVSAVVWLTAHAVASSDCTPGYSPCIPPGSDVDCAGGSGNGPRYVDGPVYVTGSDPYGLDADGDGVACET